MGVHPLSIHSLKTQKNSRMLMGGALGEMNLEKAYHISFQHQREREDGAIKVKR